MIFNEMKSKRCFPTLLINNLLNKAGGRVDDDDQYSQARSSLAMEIFDN